MEQHVATPQELEKREKRKHKTPHDRDLETIALEDFGKVGLRSGGGEHTAGTCNIIAMCFLLNAWRETQQVSNPSLVHQCCQCVPVPAGLRLINNRFFMIPRHLRPILSSVLVKGCIVQARRARLANTTPNRFEENQREPGYHQNPII